MSEATYEDAVKLVDYQATLTELRRLKHQLEHLPQQQELQDEQDKLDAIRDQAGAVRLDVQRVTSEIKKHEKELDILRLRLGQEQEKLYGGGVTNAKAMKSVEAEIHAINTRVDDHETKELEGLEQLDELEARIEQLTAEEEGQTAEVAGAEQRRDEAAREIIAATAEAEVLAHAQRTEIPRDVMDEYDRVAKRQIQAVGQLKDGVCTACGINLPSIEINELRAGPTIGTCPCPREIILLVDKL